MHPRKSHSSWGRQSFRAQRKTKVSPNRTPGNQRSRQLKPQQMPANTVVDRCLCVLKKADDRSNYGDIFFPRWQRGFRHWGAWLRTGTWGTRRRTENLLPIMYNVWKAWKTMEAKKPEKLDKLLRCSMISMLMEIRPGLKEATGGSGTAGAAENSGVDRLGGLLGVPQVVSERETLYLDQARKPVP